jgi:hypothetical protein
MGDGKRQLQFARTSQAFHVRSWRGRQAARGQRPHAVGTQKSVVSPLHLAAVNGEWAIHLEHKMPKLCLTIATRLLAQTASATR